MASVLITRPLIASELLATELRQAGYDTIVEPLLNIIPTSAQKPATRNIQASIITSANALLMLESPQQIDDLIRMPCYCVGSITAEKAKEFGFTHIQDAKSDGPALAQLIKRTRTDKSKALLHICGRDIDSKAQDELQKYGFQIALWPIYAAEAAMELTKQTIQKIMHSELQAILVFSTRTAETLGTLISQHGLQSYCKDILVIGISENVIDVLKTFTWRKLIPATMPTEESVTACLKENLSVS